MSGCGRCAKTGEWECIYCNSHMLDAELARLNAKITSYELAMELIADELENYSEFLAPIAKRIHLELKRGRKAKR